LKEGKKEKNLRRQPNPITRLPLSCMENGKNINKEQNREDVGKQAK